MILVDLNQVLLSGLMAQIANQKGTKLDEDLVRHLILNIIRMHVKNFRKEYGEVVLACDNRKYWRKDFFPFYKAHRKKNREKSNLDWNLIFNMLAKFKEELNALQEVFGDELTTDISVFEDSNKNIALQIVSGREGISLKKAEYLVYYNIDFSATSYWQSRDRMTTKDRLENKVYWVFAENGIEDMIYKAVSEKKDYTVNHFKKDLFKTAGQHSIRSLSMLSLDANL